MKQFACGDVVPGCTAVFTGPTSEDVLFQVAYHARCDHGFTDISPELAATVQQHIVAAA